MSHIKTHVHTHTHTLWQSNLTGHGWSPSLKFVIYAGILHKDSLLSPRIVIINTFIFKVLVQGTGRAPGGEHGNPCCHGVLPTHSRILAWETPWTEEPGGLQSIGSQRVGHDWVTSLSLLPRIEVTRDICKEYGPENLSRAWRPESTLCPTVAGQSSKHWFTKRLLFYLHVNCLPLKFQSTTPSNLLCL